MKQRLIKFSCPTCRTRLAVPLHLAGVADHCPKCGVMIVAPQSSLTKERSLPEVESPGPLRPGWAGTPELQAPSLEEVLASPPPDLNALPAREARRASGEGRRSRTVEKDVRLLSARDLAAQLELPVVSPPEELPPHPAKEEEATPTLDRSPLEALRRSARPFPEELSDAESGRTELPPQDRASEEAAPSPHAEAPDLVEEISLADPEPVLEPEPVMPHDEAGVEPETEPELDEQVDLPDAPPPPPPRPAAEGEESAPAEEQVSQGVYDEPEVVPAEPAAWFREPMENVYPESATVTPKAAPHRPSAWEARRVAEPDMTHEAPPIVETESPWGTTEPVGEGSTPTEDWMANEPRPTITPPGRLGIGAMHVMPSPSQEKRDRLNRFLRVAVVFMVCDLIVFFGYLAWRRYGASPKSQASLNSAFVKWNVASKAKKEPPASTPAPEPPKAIAMQEKPSAPQTESSSGAGSESPATSPSSELPSEKMGVNTLSVGPVQTSAVAPSTAGHETPAPMPSTPATPETAVTSSAALAPLPPAPPSPPVVTPQTSPPPAPPSPTTTESTLSQMASVGPTRPSGLSNPSFDLPPVPPSMGAPPSGPVGSTATDGTTESPPSAPPTPPTAPPPAPEPPPLKIDKVPPSAAVAADSLKKFIEAPTWKERIKYCQKQSAIRDAMEAYYSTHADGPIGVTMAQFMEDYPAQGGHPPHVLFSVQTAQNLPPFLTFVDKPAKGAALVDWEAFVELKDQALQKFFATATAGRKAKLRMVLRRRTHGDDSPDSQTMEPFEVVMFSPDPKPTYVGEAYAPKAGSVCRLLLPRLPWNTDLPVTATLLCHQSKSGHKWVEVESVSFGWKEEERSKR